MRWSEGGDGERGRGGRWEGGRGRGERERGMGVILCNVTLYNLCR